ncbi:MAG TPA: 1,2-phenylacetyl-CoA epoxidase subunit PaaC [Puia sp.]|jgi:ring-1,2-phenylacetyl-CoA epoxidase subunit PaaC|nr:1,2-phenylacetyl-CoA epoxidase subunit PaaC [Puia sp.]
MSHPISLINFTLHLADDALILGHRNSEWTGHGPILEQDIAISNIALDLIGQARNFYQYAARLIQESPQSEREGWMPFTAGGETTEDSLAYLRDGWDFKNCLLVEQANGDWARTLLRQFFFSAAQYYLYERLQYSKDTQLAAISEKAFKEVAYHLRWSSEWVIRLGDGTAESHARLEKALEELWKFTGELFVPAPYEQVLIREGIGVDFSLLQPKWEEKVREIFIEAQLSYPAERAGLSGGKEGRHTEQLGYILAEMQFLQRAYPGCEW